MNSNTNYNIFQISQQIQEQRLNLYEQQAKQITNAYRKVQQIKTQQPHKKNIHKLSQQYKPTSTYAIKVKEALKQINVTKAKQCKGIVKNISNEVNMPIKKNRQQQKLFNVGLNNLFSFLQNYQEQQIKKMWLRLISHVADDIERQNFFIRNYRKYRILRAWKDEIVLMKIQRKNKQKDTIIQANQLSAQFRTFSLLKRSFGEWRIFSKREAKRKQYQKQLLRKEYAIKQQERKNQSKTLIKHNQQLQSKVRNFVGKLKQQIENKDRLNTIKENTEESEFHNKPLNLQEIRAEAQEQDQNRSQENEQQQNHQNKTVIKPPTYEQNHKNNKQMTNQQLQKKRKQLQMKHKGRKQALQKLRKQRQQKRKEQQMQQKQLQKQIQAQEKRIKQQKYKQYLKNKKEQEQWEIKQKQLEVRANDFNLYRLKKFHGWLQLFNAKKFKKQKTLTLYQTILSLHYRIKSKQFLQNTLQTSKQALQLAYEKVGRKYRKNLLRKVLQGLFTNLQTEKQRKQELLITHDVNRLKIFYSLWKRAMASLRDQNVEWQLPRKKRADHFYSLQLFHKGLKSLKLNKQQEQREKIINQQKLKIKNKIKNMLQDEGQIDYTQFL